MHHRSALLALSLLVALPGVAAAQCVSWFFGPAGGEGDVVSFDEASGLQMPAVPALTGIHLLPLDFVGRTGLDVLRDDRPRLASDVPGAGRVVLPFGGGSLYHYRRDDLTGSAFGYFRIDSGGVPAVLFELATGGAVDPFLPKVGLAPDGTALVAATTVAAGGDVYEIDLLGTATNRTANLAPLDVQSNGLAFADGWGVVVTSTEVLRFDRAPGAMAVSLTFPVAPAFVGNGVVCSADGTAAAAMAGASATSAHVWVFGAAGAPKQVTPAPTTLAGAGFLPETPDGPYLALSPDGSACLWRSEEPTGVANETTGEAWARLTQLGSPAPVQLTGDLMFEDTLDSTGEFDYFKPFSAVVLVGEAELNGGIDGGDLYQIDIDPMTGATTTTNLSQTSGVLTPPFTGGTLKSEAGIWRVPGTSSLLVHEDLSSGDGNLVLVTADSPGLLVLKPNVASVDAVAQAGTHTALLAKASDDSSQFLVVPPSLATADVLASLPSGFTLTTLATRPDGLAAVLLDVPGGGEWIARVETTTGFSEVLIEAGLPLGPTIGFTPASVAFSVDFTPQRSLGVRWGGGVNVGLFPTGNRPAIFLPVF